MGCSPSKGKLFSKPESPGLQKALLDKTSQDSIDSRPVEEVNKCLESDGKENGLLLPTEEYSTKDTVLPQLSSDTTGSQKVNEIEDTGENETHQIISEVEQTEITGKKEKKKKNRSKKKSIQNQRKSSVIQTKVDFPPQMVRAHQAAYAFLNPNISKYETLMALLDQAAQTQLSLQPLLSALVLRFEELNQALEEIADEGELMLKEHGNYMALPSGMIGPAVITAKPTNDTANHNDPPSDLLQLLLQQSTEKMRLVGGSAQALGDTTLQEAVEYFSSVSKLLFEKLQAKQAAERRLAQVLAWVEGAAIRKSNPEDLALHSEDSGIGGENESLTGSERHRHHRGSAGSGSSGSGANVRGAFDSLPNNNLPNLIGHNEDDEDDEEDDNEDDEEYGDDLCDRPGRKRSNSSPPDPSQPLLYMHVNYVQGQCPTVKRPMTAISAKKPETSSSITCENIVMELQMSQKDLDQRLKKIAEIQGNKDVLGPHHNLHRAGVRRHSLCGSAGVQRGLLRPNQSPCSLPVLAPQPPKKQSVRRLINTFSQGVDGRPGQSLANIPHHIRRSKKSEILLLSDTINGHQGGLIINGNNNNNSWPDGRDDLDVETLPPPPPEVLMDNSFQSTEGIPRHEDRLQDHSSRTLPIINQRTGASHRLKASLQNVEVLPNRANVNPRPISIFTAHPVRQDAVMGAQDGDVESENYLDPELEKANCLYQQARKIIHLRNAAEFPDKRNLAELSGREPRPLQARMGQRCESNDFNEGEMSSCLPVTAPPVSRVRLPPSCPIVRHRFPSPPVVRLQSNSRPSSRPSSPRTVVRATDNHTEEIIPSVSFQDARSVFCQNELNSQTCTSAEGCVLPRPWGEVSRGRIPTRGIDNTTRRTQSEQRPGLSSQSEFSRDSASSKAKGNEHVTTKNRSASPLMTSTHIQLDPSATVTTA